MQPKIAIVLGSKSDLHFFEESRALLAAFNIDCQVHILSAHRSTEKTVNFAKSSEKDGLEVIIAGAGAAAHLPGIIAAHTCLPVLGVPISSSALTGWDSLLSICQMPRGVPVATMSMDRAGAINAAIFSAQILSQKHLYLKDKLKRLKQVMEENIAFSITEATKVLK